MTFTQIKCDLRSKEKFSIACPICKRFFHNMLRYPNAICNKCINKYGIFDLEGNSVNFFNTDNFGYGIIAHHHIGDSIIKDYCYDCKINNIQCHATEYRFGGIVIEKNV